MAHIPRNRIELFDDRLESRPDAEIERRSFRARAIPTREYREKPRCPHCGQELSNPLAAYIARRDSQYNRRSTWLAQATLFTGTGAIFALGIVWIIERIIGWILF